MEYRKSKANKLLPKNIKRFALSNFNKSIQCSLCMDLCQGTISNLPLNQDCTKLCEIMPQKKQYVERWLEHKKRDQNYFSFMESQKQQQVFKDNTAVFNKFQPNRTLELIPITDIKESQEHINGNSKRKIQDFRNKKIENQKKSKNLGIHIGQKSNLLKDKSRFFTNRNHHKRKLFVGENTFRQDNLMASKSMNIQMRVQKRLKHKKNQHIEPHYINMDIWVDPETILNGVRKQQSMSVDYSNVPDKVQKKTERNTMYSLNYKNIFDPVFKTILKSKQQKNRKQEFSRKFESFLSNKQNQPVKLTHLEHMKMKILAIRKKQQQMLKSIKKYQSENSMAKSRQNANQNDNQMQGKLALHTKKAVNINNPKNYEQLIRKQVDYEEIQQNLDTTRTQQQTEGKKIKKAFQVSKKHKNRYKQRQVKFLKHSSTGKSILG